MSSYSVELISGLTPKNNGKFPLVKAHDVEIDERGTRLDEALKDGVGVLSVQTEEEMLSKNTTDMTLGMFCYVVQDNITYRLEKSKENNTIKEWVPFGLTVVKLDYVDTYPEGQKIYYQVGDKIYITVYFSATNSGKCNIQVYRNSILYSNDYYNKGIITLDLGEAVAEGTYSYSITGADAYGNPSDKNLSFTIVVGGVNLTTNAEAVLKNGIEADKPFGISYEVSCADISQIPKISASIIDNSTKTTVLHEDIRKNSNESSFSGTWNISGLNHGSYTISMIAYTGNSLNDTDDNNIKSSTISYSFSVLETNEITIYADTEAINNMALTTNTFVNIPYTVLSLNASVLGMNGTLTNKSTGNIVKEFSTRNIVSGSPSVWSIGYMPEGIYDYELIGTSRDGTQLSTNIISGSITVALDTSSRFTPVLDNLVAWFDANDMANSMGDPSIWNDHRQNEGNLHIKLHDLNYSSNGWKYVNGANDSATDGGQKMLKFTGDSYGELLDSSGNRYSPFSTLTSNSNGFTLEVKYRTRCIGDLNTAVLTCQQNYNRATPGISATYDKLYVRSNSSGIVLDTNENNWIHATFVVDRTTNRTKEYVGIDKIENMNPIPMMHIYINGSLCCSGYIGNDSFLSSTGESFPMYLNATMTNEGIISNFGECEIQTIRIYNAPLTSEQIVNNRIASIFDPEEQNRAAAKNELNVPTVTFTQKPEGTRFKTTNKKISTSFEVMNNITSKSDSKKNFVDCVANYVDPANNINEIWDFCEVYLQGTSSLQYPVKNYKIKLFKNEEHTQKNKIVLPANPINGNVWQKENVFTLKCDFMESAHLNNTPTANFYSEVVSKVCAGHYSPARQYQEDNTSVESYYRDAIDGFPVIVYYADSGNAPTYAGTYMFNLDKSANTLGFGLEVDDGQGNMINKCQSFEGVANTADSAGCFVAYDVTPESNKENKTELQYLAKDFESRYDYKGYDDYDLDELDAEQQEEYYGPLRDMVNWVSYAADARISGETIEHDGKTYTPSTFRNEISQHFNLQYCYTYMLQMMMFGQVDNAGKNCMWDTWDGKVWYPRPYDMDTQAGLSNTGLEDIGPDCEINSIISPAKATSGSSYTVNINNSGVEDRYMSFNTKNSKFWNTFALEFRTEIMSWYSELRTSKIYDVDHIMEFYKSYTTDIIGETYYNKDMAAKYFTQISNSDQAYLRVVHGNRIQKFESWIRKRITFLDTFYEYVGAGSGNQIIEMRSDASTLNGGKTVQASLGIQVFTPQYVTIKVGQSQYTITAYVGPNSTYNDPNSNDIIKEGTLFTFPITGDDKEINISGCSNIKNIDGLNHLNLHTLTFNYETKLLSLDLSYSTRMVELIPGYNTYLQTLNLSHATMLGSSNGFQTLSLDNCTRIKSVDISYTKLQGITFAEGSNIHSVNLEGSLISSLVLTRQQFLTDINIANCENLNYYDIEYCPDIATLSIDGSTTGTFKVIGCENIETVSMRNCNNISTFDIESCPNIRNIDMYNNSSSFLENALDLTDFYNLEELNLEGTSRLTSLKLPLYTSANSTDPWNSLRIFNIKNSSIKYLGYGSSSNSRELDCSNLTNVTSMSFNGCNKVEIISNLNYRGPASELFKLCINLQKITGSLTATGNSANSCFSYCESLYDIDELETDFTACSSFTYGFSYCNTISFSSIAKILNTFGENLKNINGLCADKNTSYNGVDYSNSISYAASTNYKIPDNMFNTVPYIESMANAFYRCNGLKTLTISPFENKFKNLKNLSNAFMWSGLETVQEGFLQVFKENGNIDSENLSINNLSGTFYNCTNLRTCIYNDLTFFTGCKYVTTIANMFGNCTSLVYNGSLAKIFYNLPNLTNASYVFYNCRNLTSSIIEYNNASNFTAPFKENKKLTTINGCFSNSGITQQLNGSHTLFGNYTHSVSTHSSLTNARSVFSGCTNLTGTVGPYFLTGATYINNIGIPTEDNIPLSSNKYSTVLFGMFYKTGIEGYYDNFLEDIPRINSIIGLFRDCTRLQNCYKEVSGGNDILLDNSLSVDLLSGLNYITNTSNAFRGCTSLRGNIPSISKSGESKNFFANSKNLLANVSNMFYGCTGLTGRNLDNTDDSGLPLDLFENCASLTNTSGFMRGCSEYIISTFPNNIFKNCSRLVDTSYMFAGCINMSGTVPADLFDSCRATLSNTSYMFFGCTSLQSIESNLETNIGLLGDCINLTTVKAMFYNCYGLQGKIPTDMFNTSRVDSNYGKLTNMSYLFYYAGFNEAYIDESDNTKYLVSPTFLNKCKFVQDIQYAFAYLTKMQSGVQLHPNMFQQQFYLQNARGLFKNDVCIVGGLSNTFMINCINTLTNISEMFCWTKITSIGNLLFHDASNSVVNKVLKYVAYAFYGCTSIIGALTPFYNTSLYSMIQSGNPGRAMCFNGCTNATDYASVPDDFKTGGTPIYQSGGNPTTNPDSI